MESSESAAVPRNSRATELVIFFVALATLVGLMYYSYTYPYPSGEPWTLLSFAAVWFRELVVLLLAVVALVSIGAVWARRALQAASHSDT